MSKRILVLALIFFSSFGTAQKGKAILTLRDGTKINGIGEVSGLLSIVSVKFKNDTLRYKTYKSKHIKGIDILENNYYRKFRYKYVDGGKFPEIMEIVSIDSLSLYVRVYEGGVLTNSFSDNYIMAPNNTPQTIELENGQKMEVGRVPNTFYQINFPRFSYYVGEGESDQVTSLYTKGLPFAKGFKKSMIRYFSDCPKLIDKVENNEFSSDIIWDVVNYYNKNCFNNRTETEN